MSPQHHPRTVAPRFELAGDLFVQAMTLGSTEPYEFAVENISRSGFLLAVRGDGDSPFQVNSLLDVVIDPKGDVIPNGARCMGKVVRVIQEGGDDSKVVVYLGIAIVQIDDAQQLLLDGYLKRMESDGQWEWFDEKGQYFMRRIRAKTPV